MEISQILVWTQDHLLAVIALVTTIVFIYHYLIERDHGVKLSKKYRNSIYEAQSKIFLNATQHLISGHKDMAIKEFLNAVDLNRETMDTYFALGGLFRSNGEIEKAIGIHRSLIARENISESTRLEALKELAIDFDKGGFIDKAIETYKDVLKINRDQYEVILSLCRIYENIGEWDEAYNYRIMLSKVGHDNQAETISHILVEKAKLLFDKGDYDECREDLEDAFRFAPSVSAKILKLKLCLVGGDMEECIGIFLELLKQHPMYTTFIFVSLDDFKGNDEDRKGYETRLNILKSDFLDLDDPDVTNFPSIILSKLRLLKGMKKTEESYQFLKEWIEKSNNPSEVLIIEYIKLLIDMGKTEEAMKHTSDLLGSMHQSLSRHYCSQCGYNSDQIFWRCPQCYNWETIQFRWKV